MKSGLIVNGRPFSAEAFGNRIQDAMLKSVKNQLAERVRSIRHPVTGEFATAVVLGEQLEDLRLQVEGSPELMEIVREKLGGAIIGGEPVEKRKPYAFLSYAFEDTAAAEMIARQLTANGIEVFWAGWCINAGDSLRQKIDEGLDNCTHFIVLLSPASIDKAWVKLEIDGGLVKKVQEKCRFIPLRMMLPVDKMPALLQGMLSPSVDADGAVQQLISEIHGISRKPPLGAPPQAVRDAESVNSSYSPGALAVAKYFVEQSEHAYHDVQIEQGHLAEAAKLTWEDLQDALHELRDFVDIHKHIGDPATYTVMPRVDLYTEFDHHWKDWEPREDALKLAADILADKEFPSWLRQISDRYGWPPRRLNPAVQYLVQRGCLHDSDEIGSHPYITHYFRETDTLRRYMRDQT